MKKLLVIALMCATLGTTAGAYNVEGMIIGETKQYSDIKTQDYGTSYDCGTVYFEGSFEGADYYIDYGEVYVYPDATDYGFDYGTVCEYEVFEDGILIGYDDGEIYEE